MARNIGADEVEPAAGHGPQDARSAALSLMSRALAHLDSDSQIPSIIGAHLQSAIDVLWISSPADPASHHLH